MPRYFRLLLAAAFLVISPVRTSLSQGAGAIPEADPADVSSVDAIMAAVYDVISGPAGEARDWNRFRSLFRPEAKLIPVVGTQTGGTTARYLSIEDYVSGPGQRIAEVGFFEKEIHRIEERFGNAVHLFSTYESRYKPEDEPFSRGINSFQLVFDGSRWWVVNIFWQGESPGLPIPSKYLPGN